MKSKPRAKKTVPAATPQQAVVKIGFSPDARAAFERLPAKVQAGLRRKLREFGLNPAIGKPLIADLKGYHRVTYGRLRAISKAVGPYVVATAKAEGGIIIVHVLEIGPRKEGSGDDPYERAAIAALQAGDREAQALLERTIQQLHAGNLPEVEEDDER
jgi:mRNA-degrading endonuclease RelE of RelBE toxin-antitoxin system